MSQLEELITTIPEYITKTKIPNPIHTQNVNSSATIQESKNKYFPTQIVEFIQNNLADKLSFSGTTPIHYKCNFYCYGKTIPLDKLQKQMKCVIWWLSTLHKYSKDKCNDLLLEVYLTPFKKELLPNNGPLSAINCNTGFTTRCDMGHTIMVYREEEWFKVFLHESIHYFGLDFAYSQPPSLGASLKNMFCISSEINLYEAYTEFWAEMILMMLHSVIHSDNLSTTIRKQKKYGLEQAKKVLRNQNVTYLQMLDPSNSLSCKYRENTNAFSYYVLTSLFMFYHKEFIKWCVDNNTNLLQFNNNSFPSLLEWINLHYKEPAFIEAIDSPPFSSSACLRMTSPTITI
jgi:hypothetical protein